MRDYCRISLIHNLSYDFCFIAVCALEYGCVVRSDGEHFVCVQIKRFLLKQ